MIDLKIMAQQMSQQTQRTEEDWYKSLVAAIHDPALSQMTDGEIELFVASMATPEHLNCLLELFRQSFAQDPQQMPFDFFIRYVQASNQPLEQWVDALVCTYEFNLSRQTSTELKPLVEYLDETYKNSPSTGLAKAVRVRLGLQA